MSEPIPVRTEEMTVDGQKVTIYVCRAKNSAGRYQGHWICHSLPFCSGGSSISDDDIDQILIANRMNAFGGFRSKLERLKRSENTE
jgi:hypothetical protein